MSDITLEDVCIHEALDYKTSSGARGEQLNLKECVNPACDSAKWKVYANAASSLGNCFSCGESFNLWKFVRWLHEGRGQASDSRAVGAYLNDLRKRLGYRPKVRVVSKPVIETTTAIQLPTNAPMPYEEDGWVHPYLLERGINGHYARLFDLRWCPFGKNLYTSDDGEQRRQDFSNRILIPVFDLDGVMVTYQGRDVTGAVDDRYKFAGGLPGTGRYLLHAHVARAQGASCGLLVEGPFDVMGAQKAVDSAPDLSHIAPMGTFGMHLSSTPDGIDQVSSLRRLHKAGMHEAIIMWDPEPEAYRKALDASLLLTKIGIAPKIAMMPPGQDPGAADARVICEAIRNATPINRVSLLKLRMRNPYNPA